jgi:hypothetical protein
MKKDDSDYMMLAPLFVSVVLIILAIVFIASGNSLLLHF